MAITDIYDKHAGSRYWPLWHALLNLTWGEAITFDTLEMHQEVFVIMMAADILAPNRCQVISSHHSVQSATTDYDNYYAMYKVDHMQLIKYLQSCQVRMDISWSPIKSVGLPNRSRITWYLWSLTVKKLGAIFQIIECLPFKTKFSLLLFYFKFSWKMPLFKD